MMGIITVGFNLVAIDCCTCGITFFLNKNFSDTRREKYESFYCPNGHKQYYLQETEADKLQQEINRLEANNKAWERAVDAVERSNSAYRGYITKLKKKLKAQK